MSKKEIFKKIVEYVWQSMLGGCVVFGIWSSILWVEMIEVRNNRSLFLMVCSIMFAIYFYKFQIPPDSYFYS